MAEQRESWRCVEVVVVVVVGGRSVLTREPFNTKGSCV